MGAGGAGAGAGRVGASMGPSVVAVGLEGGGPGSRVEATGRGLACRLSPHANNCASGHEGPAQSAGTSQAGVGHGGWFGFWVESIVVCQVSVVLSKYE